MYRSVVVAAVFFSHPNPLLFLVSFFLVSVIIFVDTTLPVQASRIPIKAYPRFIEPIICA